MAVLARNILANLLSGIWIAILTLITTPIQMNVLGVEAYAVIGFITTLQVTLSVFDLGLASTLTRQIATDQSPGRAASVPLIRTAVTLYWSTAVAITLALLAASRPITDAWFNESASLTGTVQYALQVIAISLGLRWPVALYSGVLAGIQRMDVLNIVKGVVVSIRLVGGVCVVLAFRDLPIFLLWTVVSAIAEVVAYAVVCHRILPSVDWRPGFSSRALRSVWTFSLSMNGLAILTVLLTQVDRLFISKLLVLEALGYYLLAYQAATSISVVLSALSSALMPSLAEAYGAEQREPLLRRYDAATRALLFVTGAFLSALIFFGEPLLAIWVNPVAAEHAWRPLVFLAAGFWLSAATSSAYTAAVACGRAGLMLAISAASAGPYFVLLYFLIPTWGLTGAAAGWFALNLTYVLTIVPAVHKHVLRIPTASWFRGVLLPFVLIGTICFGSARLIAAAAGFNDLSALVLMVPAALVYLAIGHLFVGREVQDLVRRVVHRSRTVSW